MTETTTDWRELFKRYLAIVIKQEGTIFVTAMELSGILTTSELFEIVRLADEAEGEYPWNSTVR